MSALIDALMKQEKSVSADGRAKRMRGLAWARVSTDMQEERGLSIPEQLREIRAYAERNGIELAAEYQEAASAFQHKVKRVEFERMLDQAKSSRDIDAIIVHDYSRFSRDSLEARILIKELRQSGVRVLSVCDPAIDRESVAGVYMEAITFAKNEAYSREVAFHTKKGCKANVQTRDPETGWCYKNGGQPLWGYRSERLIRGEEKKGRPIYKSIWMPDDTVVNGTPVREWARHCLVEMAANGATLDQLRDFCNDNGIPAPRSRYWGSTTWHSLLHPNCLLEYAGYGVWNVRGKHQRMNPPEEWIIVENAHPALITEEEAAAIMQVRRGKEGKRFEVGSNRSRSSPYLLSGGLFVCGRCGSNMVGFVRSKDSHYYVCNTVPNRRGLGCGRGVYVRKDEIESEVVRGLRNLLDVCTDHKRFVRQVNDEISRIWEASHGHDPGAQRQLAEIEGKVNNIRKAIENGCPDSQWAYQRMAELLAERDRLEAQSTSIGAPPRIDFDAAVAYRRDTERLLAQGDPAERKQILRAWVDHIQLAPESLEVEVNYRIPEPVVVSMGAGAGFEPATFGL